MKTTKRTTGRGRGAHPCEQPQLKADVLTWTVGSYPPNDRLGTITSRVKTRSISLPKFFGSAVTNAQSSKRGSAAVVSIVAKVIDSSQSITALIPLYVDSTSRII
eukprot:scaffold7286_cov92-Skeletonema_marinoi.AAC.1